MIVWLNGTFGVGKTTTSRTVVELAGRFRSFDPDWVGSMVANNLADHPVSDFQHYPSWRRLVPVVADEIPRVTGQDLVAAQSVLVEEYWREISGGFADHGLSVIHVLLDADAQTLHNRITGGWVPTGTSRPGPQDTDFVTYRLPAKARCG